MACSLKAKVSSFLNAKLWGNFGQWQAPTMRTHTHIYIYITITHMTMKASESDCWSLPPRCDKLPIPCRLIHFLVMWCGVVWQQLAVRMQPPSYESELRSSTQAGPHGVRFRHQVLSCKQAGDCAALAA